MSNIQPNIIIRVNHARIGAAEDRGEVAGAAIAEALRGMADQIERGIGIIPYGSGEWVREVHRYNDAAGYYLGALILSETERAS